MKSKSHLGAITSQPEVADVISRFADGMETLERCISASKCDAETVFGCFDFGASCSSSLEVAEALQPCDDLFPNFDFSF